MRNATTILSALLDTRSATRAVAIVKSRVGEELWLVADAISSGEEVITASGVGLGDYVVHEDGRMTTNLGPVVMTVASV